MGLLIDEPPLQVLPSLAVKIGLNEAIVLQQIHYWIQRSGKKFDGQLWIYNSIPSWQTQFPFWGASTVKRTIQNLQKKDLLIVSNHNSKKFDKTKWYSINYSTLQQLEVTNVDSTHRFNLNRSMGPYQPIDEVNLNRSSGQIDPTNTRDYYRDCSSSSMPPDVAAEITKAEIKLTKITEKKLINFCEQLPTDLINHAIEVTADQAKTEPGYLFGILKKYQANGISTVDQARVAEQQHRQAHSSSNHKQRPTNVHRETLPDWAQDGYEHEKQEPSADEVAQLKAQVTRLHQKQGGSQ